MRHKGILSLAAVTRALRNSLVSSRSLHQRCSTMLAPSAATVNEKTLFDYMSTGIDINLKMGTPGETLLRRSNEYMKKAALHRLVL